MVADNPKYVTLREYVDTRLDALDTAVDHRFKAVNEMRAMVNDSVAKFMPRSEFETAHKAVLDKIEALQKLVWVGLGVLLTVEVVFSYLKR